jgi:EAL domain-containing protein (putative c-di-GMP-specific phosphodiesterase class I)/CheY-like chemotaxis protein
MPPTPNRVLLVDDEPGVLLMLRSALQKYGFETEEARDGRHAMELLGKTPFDVIVSDINMPGYPGLEFLRGVRERDLDVPIIMMTGKPSLESSTRAMEYGAFRYLIKPVMPAVLKEVIDRAIRLHEVARAKRKALELRGMDDKWFGDRATLEVQFASALGQLWVAFQPIVSCRDRSPYGYEALMRSSHPTLSNPGLLLDAAERLGRLQDLARTIRARAVEVPPPDRSKLFVNLHTLDLNDEELYSPDSPLAAIAHRVVLEITERASLDGIESIDSKIGALRTLGYSIAIDDLGAGYAGLTSFAHLNPDVVKIDMSLVRNIHADAKRQKIVGRLVELCGDLSITVISEGVETAGERDKLVDLGCDKLQGYLFAKPARGFPTVVWP